MKIIKIGASWCSACLIMRPLWEELGKEMPDLETEYYDYDEDKEMAEKYEVNNRLPTFIFLDKDGKELERLFGEISKKKIIAVINKYKEQ